MFFGGGLRFLFGGIYRSSAGQFREASETRGLVGSSAFCRTEDDNPSFFRAVIESIIARDSRIDAIVTEVLSSSNCSAHNRAFSTAPQFISVKQHLFQRFVH